MNDEKVDILLATYNGEKYLEELINSIVNQTYSNWYLIIRDDGSNDNTINIITDYCEKYPDKITIVKDSYKNLGVIKNFSALINYSQSKYIMFSDQDDIWLPNKIELSINKIKSYDNTYPLLIHTDLKVVDENLNIISDSFWKYKNINPKDGLQLGNSLCQNSVTGCTVIINKALKELITSIPEQVIMHDWWISIVALIFGKVYYITETTILYRQHSNNTLGAGINFSFLSKLLIVLNANKLAKYIDKVKTMDKLSQNQAKYIIERFDSKIRPDRLKVLSEYSNLSENNFLSRKFKIFKYKYFKTSFIRNISMFFFS